MFLIGVWSAWVRYHGRLHQSKWLHRTAVLMTPSGFLAVLAGWITTEVGRQPWTVYGLLKTSESIAPIDAAAVGTSLTVFVLVYLAVFGSGTFYAVRLMASPPLPVGEEERWLTRSAGIMPGPAIGRERHAHSSEEVKSHGD